jgi:two-component system, NtrC family, response regulator GlrR
VSEPDKPDESPRTPTGRTAELGRSDCLVVQRFTLEVVEGPDQGASFSSSGDRAVLGVDRTCSMVLTDETVSRFHCEITLARGRPLIVDLGSRNGTLVDGVQVLQAYVPPTALIRLGRTTVRFEAEDHEVEIPISPRTRFGGMVGRSPVMRAVFALMERAAQSDVTVLLEGETGTGKEAAARAIHGESARKDGPLIVVDCGAVPPDLLESELFGHEKGAFTGATQSRVGAFEAASGGTLFLDEIGELSLDLQPKLLRAIERREIKRVGTNTYQPVDVRLVAATNRDLRDEVNGRRFRSDLYYRLAVLEIRLPPLRERADDLLPLRDQILADLGLADAPELQPLVRALPLQVLSRHTWPGNVRELRNYLERCIVLRHAVGLPESADEHRALGDAVLPLRAARDRWQRKYLEDLLTGTGDNVAAAARAAGVDRIHLYRLLRKHGLR